MASILIAYAIPVFFALIALEVAVAYVEQRPLYRFQDTVNSLSCGVGQQALSILFKAWTVGSYVAVYETVRLRTLDPGSVWVWLLGGLGVDFAYYWFHRASHRVGFLWAAHVVHHQSEEYNLSTALRQSALQGPFGAPFYWPLAVAGLPPAVFLMLTTTNTLYQFWIHTRLVPKLGPLEGIFNTPSNHRVHHGIDPKYIDRNHGGILIIWDRLFGTYQPEEEEPAYGTVKPLHSWNPLWANLEAWARMVQTARATRRLRDKVGAFFAPPEWRPADLGGPVTVPPVDHAARVLYERPARRGLTAYLGLQFAVVSVAVLRLLVAGEGASPTERGLLVAWILASLLAWGGLMESKRWAPAVEGVRLLALPLMVFFAPPGAPSGVSLGLVAALLAALSGLWLAVLCVRPRPIAGGAASPTTARVDPGPVGP